MSHHARAATALVVVAAGFAGGFLAAPEEPPATPAIHTRPIALSPPARAIPALGPGVTPELAEPKPKPRREADPVRDDEVAPPRRRSTTARSSARCRRRRTRGLRSAGRRRRLRLHRRRPAGPRRPHTGTASRSTYPDPGAARPYGRQLRHRGRLLSGRGTMGAG